MSGGDTPGQVKIEIRPVKVEIEGGEEVRGHHLDFADGHLLDFADGHHLDPAVGHRLDCANGHHLDPADGHLHPNPQVPEQEAREGQWKETIREPFKPLMDPQVGRLFGYGSSAC